MIDQSPRPYLTLSPSFSDDMETIPATDPPSAAAEGSDDEFEFEFSVDAGALTAEPADEIFSNGWILPVYPVFDRGLLLSDPDPIIDLRSGSTSSTSSSDSLEIDAAGSYCTWTPRSAPQSPKKSSSLSGSGSERSEGSGSEPKRWRMRDLILGRRRSVSDGDKKFGFLKADSGLKEKTGSGTKGTKSKEMDMGAAHKMFYGNGKEKREERRSFLPYRPELVGLFSRSHHQRPFHY